MTKCAECGKTIEAVRATRRYCSLACRLRAHRKRKRMQQTEVAADAPPAKNVSLRWLHCPCCGLMSLPERYMKAPHPIVARVQTSRSQPGRMGGWSYTSEPPTAEEHELLREASDKSETYLARALGSPTAKSRTELAAEIERLRLAAEMLQLKIKMLEANRRST